MTERTDSNDRGIYDFADRVIADMNKRNLRAFGRLSVMKFDELNVFKLVGETYDSSAELAKKRYKAIYEDAYLMAFSRMGRKAEDPDDDIMNDWLLDMLEDFDAVTHYRFNEEVERKKARTAEALVSTHDGTRIDRREVDRALKLWTLQVSQYADRSVDDGMMGAYRKAGVKYVRWNTEEDDRVCADCHALDGKVFPVSEAPRKQHYRCRCWLSPVMKDGE